MLKRFESQVATIESNTPRMVQVRFKKGHMLTVRSLAEVMDVHNAHFNEEPHDMMMVTPAHMDFDVDVMHHDHCKRDRSPVAITSITWVANSRTNQKLIELYYKYHPSGVPLRVFQDEEEAQKWIAEAA